MIRDTVSNVLIINDNPRLASINEQAIVTVNTSFNNSDFIFENQSGELIFSVESPDIYKTLEDNDETKKLVDINIVEPRQISFDFENITSTDINDKEGTTGDNTNKMSFNIKLTHKYHKAIHFTIISPYTLIKLGEEEINDGIITILPDNDTSETILLTAGNLPVDTTDDYSNLVKVTYNSENSENQDNKLNLFLILKSLP